MSLLEIRDLHVWFEVPRQPSSHVIRGVDLSLDPGQRLGLVGESGCGKSTTVMAVMGLLPPTATVAGQIFLDGRDILRENKRSPSDYRWRDIAMVFQGSMNTFSPVRRVNRQIADAISVRTRTPYPESRRRADQLLERVGIPAGRSRSFPHELSGGMRQRAAIALALCCNPRILLADEPTTALDPIVQSQVMELLVGLCEQQSLALVLVSHDLAMVLETCTDVSVMYAGGIVEAAPSEGFYTTARHPYTQLMMETTLYIDDDRPLRTNSGAPPLPDCGTRGCAFRPRCGHAFDRCAVESPPLLSVGLGHASACHLENGFDLTHEASTSGESHDAP